MRLRWAVQNHLFYSVFFEPHPAIEGVNLHPPWVVKEQPRYPTDCDCWSRLGCDFLRSDGSRSRLLKAKILKKSCEPVRPLQSGNVKRPGRRGFKKVSEFGNSSLQGHEKAPKTHVLLCFGAMGEGRMICDPSLLTS